MLQLEYIFHLQGCQLAKQHHHLSGAVRCPEARFSSRLVSSAHEGSPAPSSRGPSSAVPTATSASAARFAHPATAAAASSAATSAPSSDAARPAKATTAAAATRAEGRRSFPSLGRSQAAGADVERPAVENGQNFAQNDPVVVARGSRSELSPLSRLQQEQPLQLPTQRQTGSSRKLEVRHILCLESF